MIEKMYFNIKNLIIFTFLIAEIFCLSDDAPIVKTYTGKYKGTYKYSVNNRQYRAFTGIQYAKAPEGNLRFKSPVPVEKKEGVLDATQPVKECAQFDMLSSKVLGEEDCLYLNVYSPHTGEGPLYPVVFFIHGGAFQYGSSKTDGAKYFMDKDLVFVNINYRLGPFGFLSTGDKELPGNYGLKDQNLALKWVIKNIKRFGGDPKKITLQGCSAGGASVHYHYLSPMSRGLFQNGISMSGNALDPWAFAKKPITDTEKVANFTNCPTKNTKVMVECLKKLPADQLAIAAGKLLMSEYLSIGVDRPPFRPVVEHTKDDYFINRSPKKIIKHKEVYDVPWIVGVTSEEGIMFTRALLLNQTSLTYVDENWDDVGPYIMFLQDDVPKSKRAKVARAARKHYMGDKPLNVEDYSTLKQLIYLTGDKGISFDAQRAAVMQAEANKSPVRLYYYSYRSNQSLGDFLIKSTEKDFGVCHCDDAVLIIESQTADPTEFAEDMEMQKILVNMTYSLATDGEPNIGMKWPNVKKPSVKDFEYLHIGGPDYLVVNTTDNFAEKKFWNSIGF